VSTGATDTQPPNLETSAAKKLSKSRELPLSTGKNQISQALFIIFDKLSKRFYENSKFCECLHLLDISRRVRLGTSATKASFIF
jgi:hypothetical protein